MGAHITIPGATPGKDIVLGLLPVLGRTGMFSRISWSSWDLLRMMLLSFTAVCILLTFDWFHHRLVGASDPHGVAAL